ncbi:MAG: glycosyltransferase family 1 protein [Candidatus Edwardsbacteria bacterium]|nr:glycosyltransferase family 1 protein [Candidatus Edwardsbacteria bacterium]
MPLRIRSRTLPKHGLLPWLNWTLPNAVRRDRIDVMYFPVNECWWRPVRPTVATLLDVAPYADLKDMYPGWKDRLQAAVKRATIVTAAARVVTISHYSARSIRRWQPRLANRIAVVQCGLSSAFSAPVAVEKAREPSILFVGGFDRRKNIERLVSAFEMLVRQGRPERLVLAGKRGEPGALYYDIDAIVNENSCRDRIVVLEPRRDDDLVDLYRTAAVLVLPSLVEGFGLPVLEAMACGCPVACSRAAALPEVGGDAAVYFDPLDTADIASTIGRLLADGRLRSRLVRQGRRRAVTFSWNRAGDEVYRLLRETACG